MTKDLTQMSRAELLEFTKKANELLEKQEEKAIQDLIIEIKRLALENEISIDEVVKRLGGSRAPTGETKTRKKSTVRPQFAHPENNTITWTGRGRTPPWVLTHVKTDKLDRLNPEHQAKLDEIRIENYDNDDSDEESNDE